MIVLNCDGGSNGLVGTLFVGTPDQIGKLCWCPNSSGIGALTLSSC